MTTHESLEPLISIIVLAAGFSRRMSDRNKLLELISGEPVVCRTTRAAVDAAVGDVIVVTGFESDLITATVAGLPVGTVHNPEYRLGMSTSISCGISFAGNSDGYAILPGDLPFVDRETIKLLAGYLTNNGIVVPTHRGQDGHPVVFGCVFRDQLLALVGDRGARSVIDGNARAVSRIEVTDAGTVTDLDTEDALERVRVRFSDDQ